jgi:hypothetical protein
MIIIMITVGKSSKISRWGPINIKAFATVAPKRLAFFYVKILGWS